MYADTTCARVRGEIPSPYLNRRTRNEKCETVVDTETSTLANIHATGPGGGLIYIIASNVKCKNRKWNAQRKSKVFQ
jgi:hypothetical protein